MKTILIKLQPTVMNIKTLNQIENIQVMANILLNTSNTKKR